MSFSDDVKLKAQSALKPYLGGDYSSQVRNPILLLNYLYQHAIIPSPRYCVMPTVNQSQHAVSCCVGDLQTLGNGSTNKMAKAEAAQQVLDLLLKQVDVFRVHSSLNGVNSVIDNAPDLQTSLPFNNISCYSTHVLQNRLSPPNTKYQMVNCISNGINRLDHTMEPQMARSDQVQTRPQSNVLPENIATDRSETQSKVSVATFQIVPSLSSQRSNCDSDKSSEDLFRGNSFTLAQKHPSYDDFFNPFFRQDKPAAQNKVSANTMQSTSSLSTHQSSKVSEGTFFVNSSSNAPEQPSSDNFFDPFFKQRPPNSNSALIMETESFEDLTQNQNDQSNHNDNKQNTMESKNVFALLQKKTQKHLKLIPRFRIENTESGFRCNVQLGSYYASGEGKNKKEAKTRAAVSLLNQVNDLN